MSTPAQPVSLFALYRLCFVVGLFSFGGGLTAWFHREVVLVRGWMTDEEFFSGYSLAQILPGVNSTNMAVYIGQHLRGAIGATVALLGLLTGPFVIVIAAAAVYHHLVALPGFAAIMGGVAAAAVGMHVPLGMTSARGAAPAHPVAAGAGRDLRRHRHHAVAAPAGAGGAGAAQHRRGVAAKSDDKPERRPRCVTIR